MLKAYETPEDEPVPPECRAAVDLIQSVLDGESAPESLDVNAHATACPTCRERVRAARVLMSVLALPPEPVAVPAGFADRVVQSMWAERHARTRLRSYATTIGALAAALLVAIGLAWYFSNPPQNPVMVEKPSQPPQPEIAPAPREKAPTPEPAPDPRPIRVSDAIASTGQAILGVPNPLANSVAVAPKVFGVLSDSFKLPAPAPEPMGTALEPARKSLTELPDAALTGLEPVTGTASKAFNRLLRDVGSVTPNS